MYKFNSIFVCLISLVAFNIRHNTTLGFTTTLPTTTGNNRFLISSTKIISLNNNNGLLLKKIKNKYRLQQSLDATSSGGGGGGGDLFARPSETKQQKKKQKKKKKNKYAKFSKADKVTEDPFDVLMKESKDKLDEIQQDEDRRRRQPNHSPTRTTLQDDDVKKIEFPDNKNIDPYDPTSFGYIEIGTIQGPHGVHGWMKVQGCTDFPERLTTSGMLLHMKQVNKRAPRKVTLAGGKCTGTDSFLVQLDGLQSRTSVQKLKGATLYYATQQDTIIGDEVGVLLSDMVGLQVRLHDGGDLVGTVDSVVLAEEMCAIPGLGHDMLEVALVPHQDKPIGTPNDLVLIPYVPEIVPSVNLSEREITIDPPGGLLDLTYIREKKVRIKGLLAPATKD